MWIVSFFERLRDRIMKRRAHDRAIAELEALDDRELNDLGISRVDIPWVVTYGRRVDDRPIIARRVAANDPLPAGQVAKVA